MAFCRLSQRIAIFSHGKIVGLGSGFDLYQNPPNAFVASFLGNSNFLKLKAQGNAAASFEGQPLSIRLTAGLQTSDQQRLEIGPRRVHRGAVTGRPGTQDDDAGMANDSRICGRPR